MELTQEYFDKGLNNLTEKMVTKDDLKLQLDSQTKELKQYTTEAFEVQQEWMDERFKELIGPVAKCHFYLKSPFGNRPLL